MSKPVVEVHIRAIAATSDGFAVFLGNQEKAFVIFVDHGVGAAIAMFMQGTQKETAAHPRSGRKHLASARSED